MNHEEMLQDPAGYAAELYRLGETKLEKAKQMTGSRKGYRDCLELAYYAILYGIKAVLAMDEALPESQEECFEIFQEFHIGSEAFPEEVWIRMADLTALRDAYQANPDYPATVQEIEKQIESAEYALLLTNMFLIGRGVEV